ncbi:hypothetical protein CCMA1212_001540 [Trichoderma ghanense]|uniref:Secreted protein n=1 Tax=Trichoderma ghanense TaxID=65468 RepID=A0ABY2HG36_9HYPO
MRKEVQYRRAFMCSSLSRCIATSMALSSSSTCCFSASSGVVAALLLSIACRRERVTEIEESERGSSRVSKLAKSVQNVDKIAPHAQVAAGLSE